MTVGERNKLRWSNPVERQKMLTALAMARSKPMAEFDKAVWRARLSRVKRSLRKPSKSREQGG